MRILHVVPSYLPAVRYGGPIYSVHGLCKALVRAGHDVDVFTTSVDGPGDSDVPTGTAVELDGVHVWYFRVPSFRRLYRSPALQAALRERVNGYDVVHNHSVFLWPTWKSARASEHCGVPYLVSPRGMLVGELVRRKSAGAKRLWIAAIERRSLERAAALHATSAEEAREIAAFGFDLPPVHIIPNGVDAAPEAAGAPDAGRPPGAPPVIAYLGRINWKKGLDRLIQALPHVPAATLVIAGNDEEDLTPSLESRAKEMGVRERLEFAGPLYGAAKEALFARASLLVLPSYSENFGNVVLEAMARGCPVAVTPEVGAAEIVRAESCGEVLPGNPAELGHGIARMLGDAAALHAMGTRGRAAVAARYSWDCAAAKMADLYRTLVVQRRPTP